MSDTASTRLSRLLALVPWLVANDGVTMEQTAERFGVSVEQLEKDLFLLIVSGLPGHGPDQLVDIQFWDDGVVHVLDPQTLDRPLRLSGDEATALLVALRLLEQVPGDHDRDALRSAIRRLEDAVGASDQVVVAPAVRDDVRDAVDRAIAQGCALRLEYAGGARDVITERTVEPVQVTVVDDRAYLDAFCRSAAAPRTFRLDRIIEATVLPQDTVRASIPAVPSSAPITAVVRIAEGAEWAADLLGVNDLPPPRDGWREATVEALDEAWLVRTVLGLGGMVEILSPAGARTAVATSAVRALASYA